MKRITVIIFASLFILLKGYSQTIEVYEDLRGNKYAAINAKGLPKQRIRDKSSVFYNNIQLYEYTSNGQNTNPITDSDGNPVYVYRIIRHIDSMYDAGKINKTVSGSFIISPDIVYSDGNDSDGKNSGTQTMDWATANGYLATANSNLYSTEKNIAVPKGCAMYRGKDGQDAPGTWRIPTLREGSLIMIYYKELEATTTQGTDCKVFALPGIESTTYWLATENTTSSQAWSMTVYPDAIRVKYKSGRDFSKTKLFYLRCIRDIP
jgi:hypothetical protein